MILDAQGFVKPGYPIKVYLPAYDAEIIATIKSRYNVMYEWFEYGPLPINRNTTNEGIITAGQTVESITFPYEPLPEVSRDDMFYFVETDRIMHAYLHFSPVLMRVYPEVPVGKKQYALYGKVAQTLDRDFGWTRGLVEFVFLPKIHVGWSFANHTNLDLRTMLRIKYAEYLIEPVTDREHLYKIVTGQIPAYEITYPVLFPFTELMTSIEELRVPLVKKVRAYMSRDEIFKLIDEALQALRR